MFPFIWAIPAAVAGVGALANLIGGIGASAKRKRAERAADKLYAERPSYEIPESYKSALQTYEGLEGKTESLMGLAEGKLLQEGARARTAAERGAISSTSYAGLSSDINQRMFDAVRDLGIRSAELQLSNQEKLAQGQQMMGMQQEKAQDWNTLGKWTTGMNRLESKGAAYAQQAAGYWQGLGSSLMNLAGTSYMGQAMGMFGGQGQGGVPTTTPNVPASPYPFYQYKVTET